MNHNTTQNITGKAVCEILLRFLRENGIGINYVGKGEGAKVILK